VSDLRPNGLRQPRPDRLAPAHRLFDEILRRHAIACERGEPVYFDPLSSLSVFTAAFLAERGVCCTSGCRHCPFDD
jgi:hypothetical protein